MTSLEECLPAELRGATITKIQAGLSGAGVYKVEHDGRALVLKVGSAESPLGEWRSRLGTQQLAADARIAPRVVHVDEARRAVVSEFASTPFLALLGRPDMREGIIDELGRLLRGVHALPLPDDARTGDPRDHLRAVSQGVSADDTLPAFMRDAIARELALTMPASGRAPVMSHNDVNPSNLAHDGVRLVLLDWDVTGPNDPYYDLATLAVFMRLDSAASLRLLSAYEGTEVTELPSRFTAERRFLGVLVGSMFSMLALRSGHPGDASATLESTVPLADVTQRMRAGQLTLGTPEGQWLYGNGHVREALR
ncbi:MAG: aminoglycoside phosphotransferase [Gemmatimonadetes bacterium]|nr:aminoglycoside phosphotransferase [Gemmatimonadota bacterium]